ncbi:symporter [Legionella maioricensis]|uniref:Symporter n=1 Tax=Legionella maioricensis TaxID=2896528 RepID=A0A9X2CXC7_9GAMM|nr:symporter [Legionella maioricensis]MCL9682569.1 symporter [Legionella maioricensis]MCL9686184.1 symporter [Legionella maioricensis]
MSTRAQAEEFLLRVEKHIKNKSSPKLIKELLAALNLHMLVTTNKEYNDFILKASTEELDLSKLLNYLKVNILNNQPLCTLLAFIQENDLVSDSELKEMADTLQLQINLLCVFEAITITMANGNEFAQDVYDHLNQRRSSFFPGNPVADFFFGVPYNTTLFERLKLISIRPGMLNILFHKKMGEQVETVTDANSFITNKHLSGWNADIVPVELDAPSKGTTQAMGVNILEASWEDSTGHAKDTGGTDNAKAGIGLIMLMEEKRYGSHYKLVSQLLPQGTSVNETSAYELLPDLKINSAKKKIGLLNIDSQWRDLYNSWNLLFVISNIDSVFMPIKLVLPSVFFAESPCYKELRLLSLFLFANLLINEDTRNNPFFAKKYSIKNTTTILKKWGEINKEYAQDELHKLNGAPAVEIETVYKQIFGNYPSLNFMRQLISFSQSPNDYHFTKAHTSQQKNPASPLFFTTVSSTTNNAFPMQSSDFYAPSL